LNAQGLFFSLHNVNPLNNRGMIDENILSKGLKVPNLTLFDDELLGHLKILDLSEATSDAPRECSKIL
jgi:hypothetical protein